MPSQQHEQIVDLLRSQGLQQLPSIAEQRAGMEAMLGSAAIPADITVRETHAGGVPADWVFPVDGRGDRVVLYLHGGGYVLGSRRTHRELAARIARATRSKLLVIDYRLAPEHPFPAALEDSVAAYQWLLDEGFPPARLAVAGDSAGGGLTLATLLALKERRKPLPACAFALSPWADLEGTGASAQPGGADDPMVRLEGLREMGRLYAPTDLRNPFAAPLLGDFRGLPPLLIQVGTRELLLDDATRVAARAWQAGVSVDLQVQSGLVHVWQAIPGLPEAATAVRAIGDFVARHFD